jgi:hypothetical protein
MKRKFVYAVMLNSMLALGLRQLDPAVKYGCLLISQRCMKNCFKIYELVKEIVHAINAGFLKRIMKFRGE